MSRCAKCYNYNYYWYALGRCSPQFADHRATKHLRHAGARGAGCVFRQSIDGEESVFDDFVIGARVSVLSEVANNEKRHVIAPRYPFVEVDPEELGRSAKPDVAFLGQLARQSLKKRFSRLDAAAGQMPTLDIGMLDQKNTAGPVDHHGACAQRRGARKPPIEMQPAADCGLQSAAKALQCHSDKLLVFRLRRFIDSPADKCKRLFPL